MHDTSEADKQGFIDVTRRCVINAERVVAFDRTPDFFTWPRAVFDTFRYAAAFVDGSMIGYVLVSISDTWMAGTAVKSAYVGDARVLPEWRGRGVLRGAMRFIQPELGAEVKAATFVARTGNRAMAEVAARFARGWPMARMRDVVICDLEIRPMRPRSGGGARFRDAVLEDAAGIAHLVNEKSRQGVHGERASTAQIAATIENLKQHRSGRYLVAENESGIQAAACLHDAPPGRKVRFLPTCASGGLLSRLRRTLPTRDSDMRQSTGCLSRFTSQPRCAITADDLLADVLRAAAERGHTRLRLVDESKEPAIRRIIDASDERPTTLFAFGAFRDATTAAACRGAAALINPLSL